jgi:hypothetical protein
LLEKSSNTEWLCVEESLLSDFFFKSNWHRIWWIAKDMIDHDFRFKLDILEVFQLVELRIVTLSVLYKVYWNSGIYTARIHQNTAMPEKIHWVVENPVKTFDYNFNVYLKKENSLQCGVFLRYIKVYLTQILPLYL